MNLLEFANEMHKELENNNHKGGWEYLSPQWIINRMRQEVDEIERAIQKGKPVEEVVSECADVANFAYFLAHNLLLLKD